MEFNLEGFSTDKKILKFGNICGFAFYVHWESGTIFVKEHVNNLDSLSVEKLMESSLITPVISEKTGDLIKAIQYYPEHFKLNANMYRRLILSSIFNLAPDGINKDNIEAIMSMIHATSGSEEALLSLNAIIHIFEHTFVDEKYVSGIKYAIDNISEMLSVELKK